MQSIIHACQFDEDFQLLYDEFASIRKEFYESTLLIDALKSVLISRVGDTGHDVDLLLQLLNPSHNQEIFPVDINDFSSFIPFIEIYLQKLLSNCRSISFQDPDSESVDINFERKLLESIKIEEEISLLDSQMESMLSTFLSTLQPSIESILTMIEANNANLNNVELEINITNLHFKALHYRLEVLSQKVILLTYTPEKRQAINKISSHLNTEIQRLQQDKLNLSTSLETYQSLGDEFVDLVNELSSIQESISRARFALNTIDES